MPHPSVPLDHPAGLPVPPLTPYHADVAALSLWPIFIQPALESSPSALSHLPPGAPPNTSSALPPQFTSRHFELWIEFQTKKGKAVSKDTWSLFVDFIRTIDSDFKEYDEAGEFG